MVKEDDTIDPNKQNLKKRLKILIKRYLIPINLLWPKTAIIFSVRMEDALKKLVTKNWVEPVLDLADKGREKLSKNVECLI